MYSLPIPRPAPAAKRDNHFNFIRLVLALLVLVSHSPELTDGDRGREILTRIFHTLSFGELAVDGFFLLSGYLIVQSWQASPEAWKFLRKRLLRIYPGFIAAALICAAIVGPLASDPVGYFSSFDLAGFARSVALLHSPELPPVFSGQPYPHINGSMWTIHYEFACYLAVLVLGLLGAVRRPGYWLAVTLTCFALAICQRMLPPDRVMPSSMMLRFATVFFTGGCFRLYHAIIPRSSWLALLSGVVLIAGLFSAPAAELTLAIAGGYLLFWFGFLSLPHLARFNKLPDVSYGVYLYAWPIQKLLLRAYPEMSPWTLCVTASLLSVIAGIASWYAVEKPFMRLKHS